MKIGDQPGATMPTPASPAAAPRKADAWQAQLERAWLDSWRGHRPEQPGAHGQEPSQATRPTAAARSERTEREEAPAGLSAGQAVQRPAQSNPGFAQRQHQAGPAPRLTGTAPIEVPASTPMNRAGGAASRVAPASLAPSSSGLLPAASRRGGETAAHAEAEAQHQPRSDHTPATAPARSSLHVAVADGTAQVTLRDAALSATEAASLPQAIAHQLLESGLESVRLYVNGRLSQHDRSPSKQRTPFNTGDTAHPVHITPLERK